MVYGEVERAKLVADVSRALDARVDDLDATLRVVAERVADALGDTCTLYLVSEDREWLEPVAHHARDRAHRAFIDASHLSDRRLRLDGNPLAEVVRTGITHFVPQVPTGALRMLLASEDRDIADRFDVHGLMTAALSARGEVIGTISVARLEPSAPAYTDGDRLLLEELAGRAGVVIDNARLYRHARDTAQKLAISEARLRAMVDSTRIGIVGRDGDARVVECNRAYAHMFGYEPDELIGTELAMLMPDSGDDVYREMFAGLRDHIELERSYRRRDGSTLYARISASLVRDEHGRVVYSLGIVEDQSERRELERQLVQAQRMEAIGRLAGGIAHDFNNILTAIIGFNERVRAQLGDSHALQRELREIDTAGWRASALTHQLLAFSRGQVLRPEPLSPNDVLTGLAPMLAPLLGADVELHLELAGNAGVVRADRNQLEQVIVNFAVNARDAMPGGGRLTVATSASEQPDLAPGSSVLISVSDTGHGMDAETREHVFEPFFTTKAPGAGSGLGLSTAFGIVKQSGGGIAVTSEPGRGTTFTVHLPRVADALRPAPRTEPVRSDGAPPRAGTILLVEDDESVRRLAQLVLSDLGHVVLAAPDGGAALALARAHPGTIDLLLTDVVMPGMSGPELADHVRLLRPGTRVLLASGYTSEEITRRGIDPRLPSIEKPFTPAALGRAVAHALRDQRP